MTAWYARLLPKKTAAPVGRPLAPPPKPPRYEGRFYVILALVVLVVTGLILYGVLWAGTLTPTVQPSSSDEIVAAGQTWTLPPGEYAYLGPFNLTTNASWIVSGSFTADPGVGAYLMTWGQYQAWATLGVPTDYVWTAGSNASSGTYDSVLLPDLYVFVWDNFSTTSSVTIVITSTVFATPAG
jgi:hypothetical protein